MVERHAILVLILGVPGSGSKHAHDFMSYGMTQDTADHTFSWVSPYTYEALAKIFEVHAAQLDLLMQAPSDKLVISGTIDKTGVATLRPFHIANTAFAKGTGASGELSVNSNAVGNLLTYRFSGQAIEDSTSIGFNELVPWKAETKQIVLQRQKTILARRVVSANKPSRAGGDASEKAGETWGAKATVTWEAADADHDALNYTVLYNTGADERWVPLATDVTGLSATVDTSLLAGSRQARVRVRATDGVNTTEADNPELSSCLSIRQW